MAALAAILACTLNPGVSTAAQLKSVSVTETASVVAIQPDWPVPRDPNQLFYLQRSSNSNTIVFTALYDSAGNLRADRPAQVYWRRYNTTGERKPLKPFERLLAFGMAFRPADTPGAFHVHLNPLPQLSMLLRQTAPGKAELLATIGGRTVHAVYAYVSLDESGWIPKVTHLTLQGVDPATGRAVTEVFRVYGGAVRY